MMNIVTLNNKEAEDNVKVIRNMSLARQILRVGHENGLDIRVVDIRPNRDDRNRSVVVFSNTDEFQKLFSSIIEDRKRSRDNNDSSEVENLKNQVEELKKLVAGMNTATSKED